MRTLKLQVQTTLDGYMAGPDGRMDWMPFEWSDDMSEYVSSLTDGVDRILLGRRLAEGFIPHWAAGPEHEPQESIDIMNGTPKLVASRTLTEAPWDNTRIVGPDLVADIERIRAEDGGDIIAYGGSGLVTSLLASGLVDELHLFVNPAATGAGLPVFPATDAPGRYVTEEVRPFACGVTLVRLRPDR